MWEEMKRADMMVKRLSSGSRFEGFGKCWQGSYRSALALNEATIGCGKVNKRGGMACFLGDGRNANCIAGMGI